MKVGKEIHSSTHITSNSIRIASRSFLTDSSSVRKILVAAVIVAVLSALPIQIGWSVARAGLDPAQVQQMWNMVRAINEGRDTDPVHIKQAQEFLASPDAANPPGWYASSGSSVAAQPAAGSAAAALEVWWPTAGSNLSGTQPIKAVAKDRDVNSYTMFWQVDGGALREMPTNTADYPHKEDGAADVNSWGGGAHTLTLVAKDVNGGIIGTRSVPVTVQSNSASDAVPMPVVQEQASALAQTQAPQHNSSGNPLSGVGFYVPAYSPAQQQAVQWRVSRPSDAAKMDVLASTPTAQWLGGWSGNVEETVRKTVAAAQSQNQAPVFIAYNIPGRDCGGFSAGGTSDYTGWIGGLSRGIGSARAVVILEPDALAGMTCLSSDDQRRRIELLSGAVSVLKSNPNTAVYLDAGHSGWIDAGVMAERLQRANVARADGFALNVSNFRSTGEEAAYGAQISDKLGGKHFVVDTSRNGNGSNGEWCNPWGRRVGTKPTTSTGDSRIDAYLWLKTPGESDGYCNGGPAAGAWWPEYALHLVP